MMKKLTLAAATALALGLPMTATAAHAQSRGYNPPAQTQRHVERWDARQHNGFYLNGRWNDGRPSAAQMRDRSFQPGYQAPRWNGRQYNGYTYQAAGIMASRRARSCKAARMSLAIATGAGAIG